VTDIVKAEMVDGLSLPELASEANRFHLEAESKAQSAVESCTDFKFYFNAQGQGTFV